MGRGSSNSSSSSSTTATLSQTVSGILATHGLSQAHNQNVASWVMRRANSIMGAGQASTMVSAIRAAGQQYNPQLDPNITNRQAWANMSQREVNQLRQSMGQTGNEAGRLGVDRRFKEFVGTSKSYNVNAALENDMKSIKASGSIWDNLGLKMDNPNNPTMGVKQIINKMDVGMKPLTKNLNVSRMEFSDRIFESFGMKGADINKVLKMSPAELNKTFMGRQRGVKQYQSTLYSEKDFGNTAFQQRDVVVQFSVRKGTDAIITNNVKETEIIIGRGYDQMIKSASVQYMYGKPKLVLNVVISPNSRGAYYKI